MIGRFPLVNKVGKAEKEGQNGPRNRFRHPSCSVVWNGISANESKGEVGKKAKDFQCHEQHRLSYMTIPEAKQNPVMTRLPMSPKTWHVPSHQKYQEQNTSL